MNSEKYEITMLAVSKAGHDKGKTYVVLRREADRVWLADGSTRTIAHPKMKKRMHVQPITHLAGIFPEGKAFACTDEDVKFILKQYAKRERAKGHA